MSLCAVRHDDLGRYASICAIGRRGRLQGDRTDCKGRSRHKQATCLFLSKADDCPANPRGGVTLLGWRGSETRLEKIAFAVAKGGGDHFALFGGLGLEVAVAAKERCSRETRERERE